MNRLLSGGGLFRILGSKAVLSGALARPSVCSFEPTPTVEAAGQEQRAVPGKAHQDSMTIATLLIAACPRTWMTMTGRMGLQVQSAGDRPDHVLDACGPRRRSATARGARQSNSPCTPAGARSWAKGLQGPVRTSAHPPAATSHRVCRTADPVILISQVRVGGGDRRGPADRRLRHARDQVAHQA
jgi:hypothetical protein